MTTHSRKRRFGREKGFDLIAKMTGLILAETGALFYSLHTGVSVGVAIPLYLGMAAILISLLALPLRVTERNSSNTAERFTYSEPTIKSARMYVISTSLFVVVASVAGYWTFGTETARIQPTGIGAHDFLSSDAENVRHGFFRDIPMDTSRYSESLNSITGVAIQLQSDTPGKWKVHHVEGFIGPVSDEKEMTPSNGSFPPLLTCIDEHHNANVLLRLLHPDTMYTLRVFYEPHNAACNDTSIRSAAIKSLSPDSVRVKLLRNGTATQLL